MNNEEHPISPKKILLAIFVTTILLIAAVSGIFFVLDSSDMIVGQISINGNTNSRADQLDLYVDGKRVDTYYMEYRDYNSYNNYNSYGTYYYFNVEVKANAEHVFQVISSDGEESEQITQYIKFGDDNHISNLRVEAPEVELTVTGTNWIGSDTQVYLFVDGTQADVQYSVANDSMFSLEATIQANSYHIIRISTNSNTYYNYNEHSNETSVQIMDEDMIVILDLM